MKPQPAFVPLLRVVRSHAPWIHHGNGAAYAQISVFTVRTNVDGLPMAPAGGGGQHEADESTG